jgi:hypothetical protein
MLLGLGLGFGATISTVALQTRSYACCAGAGVAYLILVPVAGGIWLTLS